jgi:hypothetical protein
LNDYIQRRERQIQLEADLLAAQGANSIYRIRKIENELKSIEDSYRRLSIWPLIQAGEFSAISDGNVTVEDVALAKGQWANFAEAFASKVPEGLRTPYRYGLITRDTALFKGLTRAVQYGDFLGKAILYDDLTRRQSLSKEDALIQISEEFINYNRLAGRTRNYLESVGLLWFWNFKLRSMKVALSMIRHNPLRSLMFTVGVPHLPMIGDIGSPLTDNFLGVAADGKLDYSIGPGMGLGIFSLNPWYNLVR